MIGAACSLPLGARPADSFSGSADFWELWTPRGPGNLEDRRSAGKPHGDGSQIFRGIAKCSLSRIVEANGCRACQACVPATGASLV